MDLNLNSFTAKTWIAIVVLWLGTACNGILFLYVFKPALFLSLEPIKILLLSVSITSPIWALNCLICMFALDEIFRDDKSKAMDFLGIAIGAGLICMPVFDVPILIKYFAGISVKAGVSWILYIQIGFTILAILGSISDKMSRDNTNTNKITS